MGREVQGYEQYNHIHVGETPDMLNVEPNSQVVRRRGRPSKSKDCEHDKHYADKEKKVKVPRQGKARIIHSIMQPSTAKLYLTEDFVPANEACAILEVHNCTLHSWQKKGLIEAFRNTERVWMYNVKRFMDEAIQVPLC